MVLKVFLYRCFLLAFCWSGLWGIQAFALVKKNQISGNWTNVNTWGGSLPQAGDEVIIAAGTNVNLNQVTADVLGGLTIEPGAILIITVNGSGLKVSGNIVNHGALTTWVHEDLKGTVSLHGNSYWSGQGNWNLGAIHINEHNWEFDEGLVIRIANNISGNPGSSINKNYRRTATIFHFNGSENAVLLADGSSYYYPSIIIDKPEVTDKLNQKTLSFLTSISPNMLQILGEINILKATDRLVLGPFNSLTVIRNLKGEGELAGSNTSDLIIDGSGDEINPIRMADATSFSNIIVHRPSGVVFENFFIVRDELFIADGSHVRLSNSRLTLGINGASPTAGNLTCRGFLLGGTNASLAVHGNGTLPVELKFAQNNPAEYTIENLDLNRMAGAGPVMIPLNHSLTLNGALDIAANNNLVLGNGKLYLNARITINTSGCITGSNQASLYVQGHGGNATLRFNQSGSPENRTLKYFYLNRTPGRVITLGNMLFIKQAVNVVSGKLDANDNLTLLSSASGSAGIAPISSSATLLGNFHVQSWFTGGSAAMRGTRTISSPVNDDGASSIYKQLQNQLLITGTGVGFDYPGAASIVTYHEPASISDGPAAQYNPVININDKLPAGMGFFLLFRGDLSQANAKLNSPYVAPESFAVTYTGPINQGTIRVPLSFTNRTEHVDDKAYNGYNLVGNPYPATIDWTLVGKTNTENLVSIIKPGGGMVTYSNGVVTNGGPPGTLTEDNTAIYSELPFIQSGQGFYVKAKGSGASITFTENSKAVNNAAARLLSVPQNLLVSASRNYDLESAARCIETINEVLRINLQDSKNIDETAIVFKEGYSAEYGEGDATYFSGSSVSLYSLTSDGKNVAINFMPPIKEVAELKLGVNASNSGLLKLNFTDFKGAGNHQVFLQDAYLGKVVDVKSNPVYEFSIDKENAHTFGTERFKLLFRAQLSISLKVKQIASSVELNCRYEVELANISQMEIERSTDGKSFQTIGIAENQGIYIDRFPLHGISYYRLKVLFLDGVVQTSEVVQFQYLGNKLQGNPEVRVYPNPASYKIHVNPTYLLGKNIRLVIYDLKGKKVLGGKGPSLEVSGLEKGIYLVELLNAETNQSMGKVKFIKR